jgi:hypothetical protein
VRGVRKLGERRTKWWCQVPGCHVPGRPQAFPSILYGRRVYFCKKHFLEVHKLVDAQKRDWFENERENRRQD